MKKVTGLLTLLSLLLMTAEVTAAQKEKKTKLIQVTQQSETINVSAEKLWEIIGPGFANVYEWSTGVDHSVGEGVGQFDGATCTTRSCDLNAKGFSKIEEKLTIYNEENHELAYDVVEGFPGFVINGNNHWKIIDLGNNQSALHMTINMDTKMFMGTLMGGMLKKQLNGFMPTVFSDLKVFAETGNISGDKKERLAYLKLKNKKG